MLLASGLTLTSGITIVPPPENYGYWASGSTGTVNTNVYRIAFSNDTTSSTRGTIAFAGGALNASGTGNSNFGYWGGGRGVSSVFRITFITDTDAGLRRSSLSAARYNIGTVTDGSNFGWFGGGTEFPTMFSLVDRITYSNDTTTASVRGPLTFGRFGLVGVNTSSFGWFTGGRVVAPPTIANYSTVDRVTFATDTATAGVRGPLTAVVYMHGGTGNADFGWLTGGRSPAVSSVNRIQYSTDTVTASLRGSFSRTRHQAAGTGDTAYGWFGGGYAGSQTSDVDRIDYASDTSTPAIRGVLPAAVYYRDSATTGTF